MRVCVCMMYTWVYFVYMVCMYVYVYNKTTLEGFCFDANNFLVYDARVRTSASEIALREH